MERVQASLRDQEYTRTIVVTGAPDMRIQSNHYRFSPRILEVRYAQTFAPGIAENVSVKISGPGILADGSLSQTWMSRRYMSELAINNGPKWLGEFVEAFRPVTSEAEADSVTLPDVPSVWS